MYYKHRLEEIAALNNEGDEVVVTRIYEPKSGRDFNSTISGDIYRPSNQIIVDGQVIRLSLDNCFIHPKNKKIYSIWLKLLLKPPSGGFFNRFNLGIFTTIKALADQKLVKTKPRIKPLAQAKKILEVEQDFEQVLEYIYNQIWKEILIH